jgi:hypothetical protein
MNIVPNGPVPSAWSIFGFSADNVWVGGQDADIWHYSLSGRTKYTIILPEGYNSLYTMNIWGSSPNDIWAVGVIINNQNGFNDGVIMHYNGSEWKINSEIINNYYINKIAHTPVYNKFYLTYQNNYVPDSNGVYYFEDNKLKSVYYDIFSETGAVDIVQLPGGSYIVRNRTLYKFSNESLVEVLSLKDYIQGYTRIFGRNLKDLFYKTDYGIGHYNGTDGELLYNANRKIGVANALILKNDVYFTCYNFPEVQFFIVHGHLND